MNTIRNRAVVSLATVLVTLAAGAVLETAPAAQALESIHVTNESDHRSAQSAHDLGSINRLGSVAFPGLLVLFEGGGVGLHRMVREHI